MIAKDWFSIYKLCFFRMKVGLKYKLKNMKKIFFEYRKFRILYFSKNLWKSSKARFFELFFSAKKTRLVTVFFAE